MMEIVSEPEDHRERATSIFDRFRPGRDHRRGQQGSAGEDLATERTPDQASVGPATHPKGVDPTAGVGSAPGSSTPADASPADIGPSVGGAPVEAGGAAPSDLPI